MWDLVCSFIPTPVSVTDNSTCGPAGNDGQQVIEVVGEAAGQSPDGLHLLRLAELILELRPRLFRLLALRDVLDHAEHPRRPCPLAPGDVGLLMHPAHGAVRADDAVVDPVMAAAADSRLTRPSDRLPVVGMDELEERLHA